MGSLAFAFADKAKYPQVPPEFAEHVGWLVLGFVMLVCVLAWFRSESVRRGLLALEDPRTLAVLRIGFAVMTLICFLNLEPYWRMLWSDEGIFDLAYAQDKLGRQALRGWTPDDGFFDVWGIVCFLWNKPSLFYMYGSPDFVVGYLAVFFVMLVLYMLGVFSRTTGVICWLMMSGIYNRNALYWEGTDTAYRCFWWILLFAQTGKAWSVDNWLRCRRLRAKGRLEDPNATVAQNAGKEPIYRLTPQWPRYLFMIQLAVLYCTTGCVKTGAVWAKGDSLYYALNMDHFYRFEWYTQQISAVFGTNVFRVMTWVTHWWEMTFPLVLFGVLLRFQLRHRNEAWYRASDVWWRRWGARAVLVALWGLAWRINFLALPFCLKMDGDNPVDPTEAIAKIHIVWGVAVPAFAVAWHALGRWPIRLFNQGIALGPVTRRWAWARLGPVVIDQEWLRRYTVGRRVYLTLGVMFHGNLIGFMNIGMFAFIMLMSYAGYVHGDEMRNFFAWLRRLCLRVPGLRGVTPGAHWLHAAQSPRSVRVRGAKVPDAVVAGLGLAGAALIYAKIDPPEFMEDFAGWAKLWLVGIAVVAAIQWFRSPSRAELALHRADGPALAYTPWGRALALLFVTYHAVCIALTLWPSYPVFAFRSKAKAPLYHSDYIRASATSQSWRMFAPNPPRSNTFMKTVVVLNNGEEWDLKNNAFDYRPNPWIINDRMRKMQRRMVGKGKWYLRYWAQFQCREWMLEHGELPEKVVITKLVSRIPSPDKVAEKGPYHPRKLRVTERDVQDHRCRGAGELPLYMLERYGLPITEADQRRGDKKKESRQTKYDTRRDKWDKRKDFGRWAEAAAERDERARKTAEAKAARGDRVRNRERDSGRDRTDDRTGSPARDRFRDRMNGRNDARSKSRDQGGPEGKMGPHPEPGADEDMAEDEDGGEDGVVDEEPRRAP